MTVHSQSFYFAHYKIAERAALALAEKTGLKITLEDHTSNIEIGLKIDSKCISFDINVIPELPSDMVLFKSGGLLEQYSDKTIIVTRYAALPAEKIKLEKT